MSTRAGTRLEQFGYAEFGHGSSVMVPQTGAVQDDYILGPGDEVVISLRGQENNEYRAIVDRNGQITLPRLRPISASGRSFGNLRQDVQTAVRSAYIATESFVTVGRIRLISVLVSGEVNNPGQRLLTGLSSAADALLLAGGVKKTGSLRSIRILRGGRVLSIDLYGMLTDSAQGSNFRLADGDRILVPPLGQTVAVTGLVRQPGIFELLPRTQRVSARTILELAGGREVRGSFRLSLLRTAQDGRANLVRLSDENGITEDGDILFVELAADQTVGRATLSGGTGLAGSYPIVEGIKLSDMLKAPGALGPNPYTLFGVVSRRDPKTMFRTLTAFTPLAVLRGTEDLALQGDDIVRPISVGEMRLLVATLRDFGRGQAAIQEAIRNPVVAPAAVSATGAPAAVSATGAPTAVGAAVGGALLSSANAAQNVASSERSNLQVLANRTAPDQASARQQTTRNFQEDATSPGYSANDGYSANREASTFDQIAQQLGIDPLVLTNFLTDHTAVLSGVVRGPGTYLIGKSVVLQDLLVGAGGTANWTDASSVELISTDVDPNTGRSLTKLTNLPLNTGPLSSYLVRPRDEIRFKEVFNDADIGNVTVQGEVRFAGSYKLTRGERLSDILVRTGGLTNVAYPYGTVFLRRSVAQREREGYLRAAADVQNQLVIAMTRIGNDKIDPTTFASMQTFVTELRNQQALGRISVTADPSVLASSREMDVLLEPGDVIYIPQRPATISVLGQVLQPGNFPSRAGATLADYIALAGGYAATADASQTFVVLPDGSARRVERSWLRLSTTQTLPPGSSIVVPRDITPLDLRQTIIDVTQIFSQFAVAIASVAVLSKQ